MKILGTEQYVIDYKWTNIYTQIPEYNKVETLHYGDIIEYSPAFQGYYDPENEVSSVGSKEGTKWNYCYDRNNNVSGYVPDEYIDKYVPYMLKPEYEKAFYRTDPTLATPDEKITENAVIYIKLDKPIITENGIVLYEMILRENIYSALDRDTQEDREPARDYISGYIELGKLQELDSEDRIGCISVDRTFLRQFPSVTELNEEIICGTMNNGEILNVVGKNKVENEYGNETWLECERIGENGEKATFYVAEYATIPYIEKAEDKEPAPSQEKPTDFETTQTEPSQSDKLTYVMDMSSYTTCESYKMRVDSLVKNDCLGGVIFEIGKTKACQEFSQRCMIDFKEDGAEGIGEATKKSLPDYYAEINSHFTAGQNNLNVNFEKLEDIIKYINYTINQDIPVGFYYYSCAVTPTEASAEAAYIYAVMQRLYEEIPQLKSAKMLPIVIDIEEAGNQLSEEEFFKKYPTNTTSDYQWYSKNNKGRNDKREERTEAVSLLVKLLGNGTNNSECFCIDGHEAKNGYGLLKNNQITIYSGTNQVQANEADFPNYKYAMYITSISDLRKRLGEYEVINWGSRYVYSDADYQKSGKKITVNEKGEKLYEPFYFDDERIQKDLMQYQIVDTINGNSYYNFSDVDKKFASQNAQYADIMQVILDVDRKTSYQCIDFSVTNQYTIDGILDGTYTHTEDFVDKINRVYEIQIENEKTGQEVEEEEEYEREP